MRDPVTEAVALPADLAGLPEPSTPRVEDDRLHRRGAADGNGRRFVTAPATVLSDWPPGGQ